MLSGPSTRFSYKPPAPPKNAGKRPYGFPVVIPCLVCNAFLVRLFSPRSGRRVDISLAKYAEAPALVYSFAKHGNTHFHERPGTRV